MKLLRLLCHRRWRHSIYDSVACSELCEGTNRNWSKPISVLASPRSRTFGAAGWAARAEQDLARWLIGQGRVAEAQEFVDRARATYLEIGALGWLERLDAEFSGRLVPQN